VFNIQIDDVIREATEEEAALIRKQQDEESERLKDQSDQEALKESANSKLLALGLTEAEIAAFKR
jgi:hypothetical protein